MPIMTVDMDLHLRRSTPAAERLLIRTPSGIGQRITGVRYGSGNRARAIIDSVHEMSVASSMLEAVQAESAQRGARARAVGLKIGELSGVDAESLRFCFDVLVLDTELAPLALEIERLPWRNRCRHCAHEFAVVDYLTVCPKCGAADTELASGDELEFAYLEIEEK